MSKRESDLQRLEVFHEVANLLVTQTQTEERVVVFHYVVERCEAPIVEEPALGVCPQSDVAKFNRAKYGCEIRAEGSDDGSIADALLQREDEKDRGASERSDNRLCDAACAIGEL
jgi:hypothetical protein